MNHNPLNPWETITCCECGKTERVRRFAGISEGIWYGCGENTWCGDCVPRVAANPDEEHQQLQDRREAARQENMIADIELAA